MSDTALKCTCGGNMILNSSDTGIVHIWWKCDACGSETFAKQVEQRAAVAERSLKNLHELKSVSIINNAEKYELLLAQFKDTSNITLENMLKMCDELHKETNNV